MQDKITKSAKYEDCSLRLPFICNHNPETTVFAHAPCADKGIGFKSPSWWGMYSCSSCHDVIDGRVINSGLEKEYIIMSMMPAIYETQRKLIEKKLIEVK